MKHLISIIPYLCYGVLNGQYTGTASVTQGRAEKIIGMVSATSEYSGEKYVMLAPNPGSEFLSVTMNDAGQNNQVIEVRIYNPEGVCMYTDVVTNGLINTSSLPSGMYLIKIRFNQSIFYKKWIKSY